MRDGVADGGRPLLATEIVGRESELSTLERAWRMLGPVAFLNGRPDAATARRLPSFR